MDGSFQFGERSGILSARMLGRRSSGTAGVASFLLEPCAGRFFCGVGDCWRVRTSSAVPMRGSADRRGYVFARVKDFSATGIFFLI